MPKYVSYMGSKSLRLRPGLQGQVLPLVLPSPLPPLHLTRSSKEKWHPSYRNVVGPGSAGWGRLGNRERQRGSFLVGSSLIKPRTTIKALWLSWGWNPSNQQACSTSPGHSNCGRSAEQSTTSPHKETEPTAKGQHLAIQRRKIRIRLRLLKYPIFFTFTFGQFFHIKILLHHYTSRSWIKWVIESFCQPIHSKPLIHLE